MRDSIIWAGSLRSEGRRLLSFLKEYTIARQRRNVIWNIKDPD